MKIAPDIREQRKEAQKARVKMKESGDPGYPAAYASQPSEVRKGEQQRSQRRAIADAQRTLEIAMGLDAQGSVEVFGGQIQASVGIGTDVNGSVA